MRTLERGRTMVAWPGRTRPQTRKAPTQRSTTMTRFRFGDPMVPYLIVAEDRHRALLAEAQRAQLMRDAGLAASNEIGVIARVRTACGAALIRAGEFLCGNVVETTDALQATTG